MADIPKVMASALHAVDRGVMITNAQLDRPGPRIVYVNPAWERLTGYSAEEAVGATPRLLQGPATSHNALRRIRSALEISGRATVETVNYRRDGTPFRMAVEVTPVHDDRGAVTHYVALEHDATAESSTRARLNQLEALTRLQREVTAAGLDLDARRQRVADVAVAVTGADGAAVEEVENGHMVYRAVAGTMRGEQGLRLPIDASMSGKTYREGKARLITDVETEGAVIYKEKAREVGFVSGILVPLIHENQTYGVLKVVAAQPGRFGDAERHLLELASSMLAASLYSAAAYTEELERRALLVDALPVMVSYLDTGLRYREVNAAYEERFGRNADTIRGMHVRDLLGEPVFQRIRPSMEAALAGDRVRYDHTLPDDAGTPRQHHVELIPHTGPAGEVLGLYAIVRDITEQRAAERDFLTGITNRRGLERYAAQLIAVAQRYDQPLSLVILDVDHFKRINDDLGHLAGDEILKDLADVLDRTTRDADLAGRWGGEEFALVLPNTGLDDAATLAERVRIAVRKHPFPRDAHVTVSLGVAELAPREDLNSLTERADTALYRAKRAGRDRVAAPEVAA